MTEVDLDEALDFYKKHLLKLAKQRESRHNPKARCNARDRMRYRRHPDWDELSETFQEHHERHLREKRQ